MAAATVVLPFDTPTLLRADRENPPARRGPRRGGLPTPTRRRVVATTPTTLRPGFSRLLLPMAFAPTGPGPPTARAYLAQGNATSNRPGRPTGSRWPGAPAGNGPPTLRTTPE